jgi:hypothetical protein
MRKDEKPVRVLTQTVPWAECPVCHERIMALVEVAVWLGDLELGEPEITPEAALSETYVMRAHVQQETRIRNVRITHDCSHAIAPLRTEEPGP